MVNSRLSDSGGARPIQAVLATLRGNPKVVILLGRLGMLASESGCSRAMVERVLSQDMQANHRICDALSAGVFSEPGLSYGSVAQAIDALGLDTVSTAARSMTVFSLAQNLAVPSGLNPFDFFRHSFATSAAATVLAKAKGLDERKARTAGLVHNTGILFCASAFSDDYKKMVSQLAGEANPIETAERKVFGFDHQDAARLVLPAFGFEPDVVTSAADHHKSPQGMSPMTKCVALAGLITDQLGCTIGIGNAAPDMSQQDIEAFGFSDPELNLAASSAGRIGRENVALSSLATEPS